MFFFKQALSFRLKLDFMVSVDFTASNGPVHHESSLHYISPNQLNQYEMAIKAVIEICQHYNEEKVYEACGFGAKIPPIEKVSHLFPLVSIIGRKIEFFV